MNTLGIKKSSVLDEYPNSHRVNYTQLVNYKIQYATWLVNQTIRYTVNRKLLFFMFSHNTMMLLLSFVMAFVILSTILSTFFNVLC